MKTLKDYLILYLKCDTLLLADTFGKFRKNSLKNYGLWPSHHQVNVWMQCLKWQKLNLNLFSILTFIYSLGKVKEVEYLLFLIDIANPTVNI